jgi:hypothetical protein
MFSNRPAGLILFGACVLVAAAMFWVEREVR